MIETISIDKIRKQIPKYNLEDNKKRQLEIVSFVILSPFVSTIS